MTQTERTAGSLDMTAFLNDKRRSERFPYAETVTFRQMGERSAPPPVVALSGSTIDVSEGGISVHVEGASPRKGAIVSLRLPVADMKVNIPILSEVRWVREILPQRYHVGLMFIS